MTCLEGATDGAVPTNRHGGCRDLSGGGPMDLTIATLIVVGAFAVFGLYYAFFVAGRGKAKGDTSRTWCMPQGHSDIGERTATGREIAPPDECPPPPASEPVRDSSGKRQRFA